MCNKVNMTFQNTQTSPINPPLASLSNHQRWIFTPFRLGILICVLWKMGRHQEQHATSLPIDYVFLPTVQARDFYKVEIKQNLGITLANYFSEGVTLLSVYFVKVLLFYILARYKLGYRITSRNRDCIGYNFNLILSFSLNRRFLPHYRPHLEHRLEFEPFA